MIIISGIKKPTPSRVRGLFPGRDPFWAGYGNKAWDILAYKVTKHQTPSTTTSIKIEPVHQFQGTKFNLKNSYHSHSTCGQRSNDWVLWLYLDSRNFLLFVCRLLGSTLTGSSMCCRIARCLRLKHQFWTLYQFYCGIYCVHCISTA